MKKKVKIAALSLAAIMGCATFAGCDLVTTDSMKDMAQVVAEVNINQGADFQDGEKYAKYKDLIETATILKRDLRTQFLSSGSTYVNSYGYSYEQTYNLIMSGLTNQKIIVQYAQVYFLEQGGDYTVEGFKAYVNGASTNKDIAAIEYFLDEDERAQAIYNVRRIINNTLDSQEKQIIDLEEDDSSSSNPDRTLPTGAESENSDYFDKDYKVYTGKNVTENLGSYEKVEGSKPSTRKRAYSSMIAMLQANGLISEGENVADFETLEYFNRQKRSYYESALIGKLTDAFESEVEEILQNSETVENKYNELLASQRASFTDSDFTKKMDELSDTKFVLAAPSAGYGYVINILLPFDKSATEALSNYKGTDGEKFVYRAGLAKSLKATDQRTSWFTGDTDYSFEGEGFTNGNETRNKLFFEKGLTAEEDGKYEKLEKYYGKYTFNGTAEKTGEGDDEKYVVKPNKISIDGFIGEMENYLTYAGLTLGQKTKAEGYYDLGADDYKTDNTVDYSKFVYYTGKVEIAGYDINRIFDPTSEEYKAFSVINELSFAYNTDTAGLNTYLGYSVSPFTTSYMKEFEYAAQLAVKGGAGTYTVAPTDYGWHIMYCTFAVTEENREQLFTYRAEDREKEGTFSNLYYEQLKSSAVSNRSSELQAMVTNSYVSCVEKYENRYSDLWIAADKAAAANKTQNT